MRNSFLVLCITLLGVASAGADTLDCRIDLNASSVLENKVETPKKEKVLIGKTAEVIAYVTETGYHRYSIEAFLPSYETRIYSEGLLGQETDSDPLKLSLWGREMLVDVSCKFAK